MKYKTILLTALFSGFLLLPSLASAQTSAGVLTIAADLQSSINLTFVTDVSGVALTGSGTNAATLDFGAVSRFGTPAANVTKTSNTTTFTVSTPFDVLVTKSNVTSATYALTAQMQTTDGYGWTIDTFVIGFNPTAPTALTAVGAYDANVSHTLHLAIPFAAGAATIANTINFLATAN